MRYKFRILMCLAGAFLAVGTTTANDASVRQDEKAIDVLKSMVAFKATLDQVVLHSINLTDARLGAGLMVSNSTEVHVSIDRPGSLRISSFDGVQSKELFFHGGTLTVFNSENRYYAQASIPEEIEAAMEFALEELDVEAPMMDMIYRDLLTHLVGSPDSVIYLTNKSLAGGIDCHHIVIRSAEVDIQLWVAEGGKPLPRKIVITSKWEGGAPRFSADLDWDTSAKIDLDIFEFKPPKGSVDIGFAADADRP